ncbi:hypothetical protein Vadar_019252 [Vaccinium darrowii]|uniref:Uncharacterized protein n=1 Tax=Vaccinium darrowii TaxID=229202 RepID=A0ACB7ZDN7_9ERIC|nr:hypothetical protein Vadar_019252 [Vaccinium darrowii]
MLWQWSAATGTATRRPPHHLRPLSPSIGETYILYNQQTKGNKRELIQLGAPIFGHITEEGTGKDEDAVWSWCGQ